jgi:hypothetical protein
MCHRADKYIELTMISSSTPYSVHRSLELRRLVMQSVWAGVQRLAGSSRLFGNAVHLQASKSVSVAINMKRLVKKQHSLGAPALDNTCEHHLLRVIGNECHQIIDDTPEVTIRTSVDHRGCQAWLQCAEDGGDRRVVQFPLENPKWQAVIVAAVT